MKQAIVCHTDTISGSTSPSTRFLAPLSARAWQTTDTFDVVAADGEIGALAVTRFIEAVAPQEAFMYSEPVGSETYRVYVNGLPTAVAITLSGTLTRDSTAAMVPVVVGDHVSVVRNVNSGTVASANASIFLLFEGDNRRESIHGVGAVSESSLPHHAAGALPPMGGGTTTVIASGATFDGLTDESTHMSLIPTSGAITAHVWSFASSVGVLDTQGWTFTLVLNGVVQDGSGGTPDTRVIVAGDEAGSAPYLYVTEFTLPVTVGDRVQLKTVPTATAGANSPAQLSINAAVGIRFLADVNGEAPMCISGADLPFNSIPAFSAPNRGWTGGQYQRMTRWVRGLMDVRWFAVFLGAAPGVGKSRQFDMLNVHPIPAIAPLSPFIRLTVATRTVSDTEVGAGLSVSGTSADWADGGDYVQFKHTPSSTPVVNKATLLALNVFIDPGEEVFEGTIDSIDPTFGPIAGGTAFTITGTGFPLDSSLTEVFLKGIAATGVTVVNATTITGTSGVSATGGLGPVVVQFTVDGDLLEGSKPNAWTYISDAQWWVLQNPTAADFTSTGTVLSAGGPLPPSLPTSNGPLYVYQGPQPGPNWVPATGVGSVPAPPSPYGWWWSQSGLTGAGQVVDASGNPQHPRTFAEIASFATGAAGVLGGSPGIAATYQNRLMYAARDYPQGSDQPPVRVFDGRSDRYLVRLPNDANGAYALAVVSLLVADARLIMTSLDVSGGGRVFYLNAETGLGFAGVGATSASTFAQVPYALGWHDGKLWMGTNGGAGSAAKVYSFRFGVDVDFVEERDLDDDSVGGATALASFNGKLFIGTDAEATASAKLLRRNADGTYTTVATGSGTADINGYLSLVEFQGRLYTCYWNSVGPVSVVQRLDTDEDGVTTVYEVPSEEPVIALFVHDDALYALTGGLGLAAGLHRTEDGTTWLDVSASLVPGEIQATPAFGSVRV